MEKTYENLFDLFDDRIKNALKRQDMKNVEEIRLRAMRNIELYGMGKFLYLDIIPTYREIDSSVRRCMRYSLFANEYSLRSGRVIIPGGHRVSFAGRALMRDDEIRSVDNFSSICLRIARKKIGCSENIIPYVCDKKGQVLSTLIISVPGEGKTTLLRDMARMISSGKNAKKTVIIDEKGEFTSPDETSHSPDIGERIDVLYLFDKPSGINIAVRNLSPEVIVCDEIGSPEDAAVLGDAVRCGVKVFASAHGEDISSLKGRKAMREIISENIFDRYIFIARKNDIIFPVKIYRRDLSEAAF